MVTHQLQVKHRQGKFTGQGPTFYHCATQPTIMVVVVALATTTRSRSYIGVIKVKVKVTGAEQSYTYSRVVHLRLKNNLVTVLYLAVHDSHSGRVRVTVRARVRTIQYKQNKFRKTWRLSRSNPTNRIIQ